MKETMAWVTGRLTFIGCSDQVDLIWWKIKAWSFLQGIRLPLVDIKSWKRKPADREQNNQFCWHVPFPCAWLYKAALVGQQENGHRFEGNIWSLPSRWRDNRFDDLAIALKPYRACDQRRSWRTASRDDTIRGQLTPFCEKLFCKGNPFAYLEVVFFVGLDFFFTVD